MTFTACFSLWGSVAQTALRLCLPSIGARGRRLRAAVRRWALAGVVTGAGFAGSAGQLWAENEAAEAPSTAAPKAPEALPPRMFVREYRVKGAHQLTAPEVEEAVYPYLGPDRTESDVEQARLALEKAYHDKGYNTVAVVLPPQTPKRGIIMLQVNEVAVGRLRVKGARYSSTTKIKKAAPSVAEGKVINFNDIPKDIVALNGQPDRQVTPSLHAGVEPGTVDVDLEVKDKLPVHGSVEVNNRAGPDTKPLRVNAAVSDNNLFQLGHSAGFNAQVSPQDMKQVKVFSAYYLARFENVDWLSVMVQGTKQDSAVSTLGSAAVLGRNQTLGLRTNFSLPSDQTFYQTASVGIDYKHTYQKVTLATSAEPVETPTTYYPISAAYSASWVGKRGKTEINAEVDFHLRGMGSAAIDFDNSRYNADGNFIYFRGDLSRTQNLPWGLEGFAKVQGQIANQPLLSLEQFTGGGLGTVRGYLEAETSGDNGLAGTLELRSPDLSSWFLPKREDQEARIYAFADGGVLTLNDTLPGQQSEFRLASIGLGARIKALNHFSGSIDAGVPLTNQSKTKVHDTRITFRGAVDF